MHDCVLCFVIVKKSMVVYIDIDLRYQILHIIMDLQNSYRFVSKTLNEYASPESPFENDIHVGGCLFSSLIDHPYKEAYGRLGVPVGLALRDDSNGGRINMHGGNNGCPMTYDMMRMGGSVEVMSEELHDHLLDKVAYKGRVDRGDRKYTRKNKRQ